MEQLGTLQLESPRGSLKPRVEVIPPRVLTLGDLGCELMERAGKPLDPWQCDAMDIMMGIGTDGQWSCFEYAEICPRQNGKGAILEARVLTGFLLLGEKVIMWSAHEYKTSLEAWRRCKALLFALGERVNDYLVEVDGILIKIINSHGEEGFERLDTNARIKFIARSKGSGRGFSGDLNIIDEAYAYTVDQSEALSPTILATPNPQIIYASSPPLTGDTGEVLYSLRERAEDVERGIADAVEEALGYRDWGIAGELEDVGRTNDEGKPVIDIDDQRHICSANPALGTRLTLARVLKVKKTMRSTKGVGFGRECLGLWPRRSKSGGVITPKQWAGLLDVASQRVGDIALGVDIEPDRSWSYIGLYALRADGKGHMLIVDSRPGVDWLPGRMAELIKALNPLAVACGRGTAESMATQFRDIGLTPPATDKRGKVVHHRGHLAVAVALDMSAACSRMIDSAKAQTVRHTGQDELDGAVEVAQTRQTGDSLAWSRKPNVGSGGRIGPLVTVTLAQWAYEIRGPLARENDYDLMNSIG